MIPKVINYCWFGGKELDDKSKKCIESWKKIMPDYEIKRWDESNFDVECNDFVKKVYKEKKWAFVSDYARLVIIYKYGGIYLDTDVEVIKSFDGLLENNFFCGFELGSVVNTGIGFGAIENNQIIKENIDYYDNLNINKENLYIPCPDITTEILKRHGLKCNDMLQCFKDFTIYPSEYFCPMDYYSGELKVTDKTYSIHRYNMTWVSDEEKKYYKLQKKLVKLMGKKRGLFLINIIKIPMKIKNRIKKYYKL